MQVMYANFGCCFLAVFCSNSSTCIIAGGKMVEKKLHLLSQLDWSAWPANYATVLSPLLQSLQMQNIPDV